MSSPHSHLPEQQGRSRGEGAQGVAQILEDVVDGEGGRAVGLAAGRGKDGLIEDEGGAPIPTHPIEHAEEGGRPDEPRHGEASQEGAPGRTRADRVTRVRRRPRRSPRAVTNVAATAAPASPALTT